MYPYCYLQEEVVFSSPPPTLAGEAVEEGRGIKRTCSLNREGMRDKGVRKQRRECF
jgi:hypothetical protein